MIFQNRVEAGKKLATKLQDDKLAKDLIVLAIPRGGVVVGKQLANVLNCPLQVIFTKKIGVPSNPELAVGAVGPEGEVVWNNQLLSQLNLAPQDLATEIQNSKFEIQNYKSKFKIGKLDLKDKIVVLTDDGVATGATMVAAIKIVRQYNPQKIIVAVPVIARDSLAAIEKLADEVIYLESPELFFAVGQFYREFKQLSDEEVIKILE